MRTITLELLRHGPAHNQLLSPLTPYLALCENHAAVTLHVPFEHNQFLHRLSALGYQLGEESRIFQLNDTAKVLSDLLAAIPGLTAESGKMDDSQNQLTHLRLIISASELALLPFELALSPDGLPGSGQHLLLQPQMPICLTREIRRAPGEQFRWPGTPRILFVAASPPDVGEIPLEAHLLTLRRLITPWVKYYDSGDKEMFRKRLDEHLVILPEASIEAIEKACSTNTFTHVHILAHGVERRENYDTRFFLALHHSHDRHKTDYISGARLATALRPSERPDSGNLAKPVVVTLASCDSGNVGSVAGAGASIAHALHEFGIPMVVAGQFPLSFEGSVSLVDCLYSGLLWGTDPRPLLYDLRRRLFTQFKDKHDWASLIAYVSLPPDFDQQLSDLQIEQAMRSINASMNHADEATRQFFQKTRFISSTLSAPVTDENLKMMLESARQKMNNSKQKLEKLLTKLHAEKARILGLLASTEKRQAEVLFSTAHSPNIDEKVRERDRRGSFNLLRSSHAHYWETFLSDRSKSWALVQYISLKLIFSRSAEFDGQQNTDATDERKKKKFEDLWTMALMLATFDLRSNERSRFVWAHGLMIEIYLLSLLISIQDAGVVRQNKGLPSQEEARNKALEYTDALIDYAGRNSFDVYSTRRQILRYVEWFNKISNIGELVGLAEELFEKFPKDIEEAGR